MNRRRSLWDVLAEWLAYEIAEYLPPRRPLRMGVYLTRESSMGLVYKLTLPPPGAPDVVKRTLRVTVNGDTHPDQEVNDSTELTFQDNDAVSLSIQDTDDAGNVSPWSEPYTFTAKDTIAPGQPGQVSVNLLREE